jgi:Tfp pilus assembly protein PilO
MAKIDLSESLTPKAIVNLLVILGFLIFMTWVLTFLAGEVNDGAADVKQKRGQIDNRIAAVERLAELRGESKEAGPALDVLDNILPARDNLLSLPRYIEDLGLSNRVTATFDFTGNEVSPEGGRAGNSSFKIIANGSYFDVISFIKDLEAGDFFISLEVVDMTVQKDNTFGANINGVVYFHD